MSNHERNREDSADAAHAVPPALSIEEEALLLRQCRLNKVEAVQEKLDEGLIPVKFRFSNGDTLLITACKAGHKRLAKSLLRRGAPMHGTDNMGNTALHWCYAKAHASLGEYLVEKGADESRINKAGGKCRNWWEGAGAAPPGARAGEPARPDAAEGQKTALPTISKGASLTSDPRPPRARARRAALDAERASVERAGGAERMPEMSPQRGAGADAQVSRASEQPGGASQRRAASTPPVEGRREALRLTPGAQGQQRPSSSREGGRRQRASTDEAPPEMSAAGGAGGVGAAEGGGGGGVDGAGGSSPAARADLSEEAADGARLLQHSAGAGGDGASGAAGCLAPGLESPARSQRSADKEGPALVTLLDFEGAGGAREVREITSPRSVQAMKQLGLVMAQLTPARNEALLRQTRGAKARSSALRPTEPRPRAGAGGTAERRRAGGAQAAGVRQRILEDMRQEKLKAARAERARLVARGRGGSLTATFREYAERGLSGPQLRLGPFLKMLEFQGLIRAPGAAEEGGVTKTQAARLFGAAAAGAARAPAERAAPGKGAGAGAAGKFLLLDQFLSLHKQLQALAAASSSAAGGASPSGASAREARETQELNRIERMRERYRQSQEVELRRVERHFSKVLDLKEQQAQVVKSQFRKEAQRTRRVEERMFLTARARIEEEMKHVERIMEREEERRRAAEDIRRRAEEKEREVQAALERKAYEQAERRRLKHTARQAKEELKRQAAEQHARKMQYLADVLKEKQDREEQRARALAEEQERADEERLGKWTQDQISKDHFTQVRAEYERSGEVKLPTGVESLGMYDQLINAEHRADFTDRNPDAVLLERDVSHEARMRKNQYHFYKVCVEDALIIKFNADSKEGIVSLFVGNCDCPRPTAQNHTWSKGGFEHISIFHMDRNFTAGYVYLGVQCMSSETRYLVTASWITEPQNVEDQAMAASRDQENAAIDRAKARIDALLRSKLADKSPEFVAKYSSMYKSVEANHPALSAKPAPT